MSVGFKGVVILLWS